MKCRKCNCDLGVVNGYLLNHICDPTIDIQPERSKREDFVKMGRYQDTGEPKTRWDLILKDYYDEDAVL